MIDDVTVSKMSEDEINMIAKKYSDARKSNKKNEENYYMSELYKITIGDSILNRKLRSIISAESKFKNDTDNYISDYFIENIKYYKYEKNDNFVSFMLMFIKQYLIKNSQRMGKTISLEDMTTDEDGNINYRKIEKIGKDETYRYEELAMQIRAVLPTLITNFYKHLSTKSATKERYYYFRIFNTENIAALIYESGNTRFFNKKEAYESTDKDYIRFIADSDYEKLDDLINLRFRRISEVLEDSSAKNEKISFPVINKVIAEYWYKSGIGNSKPTVANVSDFRKKYSDYCRMILAD